MASLRKFRVALFGALVAAAILAVVALIPSQAIRPGSGDRMALAASAGTAAQVQANMEDAAAVRAKPTPQRRAAAAAATLDLQDARVVATHFDELKTAALGGDSAAAQALHAALDNCRGAPREAPPANGPANSRTAVARYKFANCGLFDTRQLAFDAPLVHDMAERGDNLGRVAYYQTGALGLDPAAPDYREHFSDYAADALRYLQAAASDGDGDALWSLGDAYSEGRIVAADSVRASAYRLSWRYLQDNPGGTLDMDRLLNLAERQMGASVDAGEEARVAQMAAQEISQFRGNR